MEWLTNTKIFFKIFQLFSNYRENIKWLYIWNSYYYNHLHLCGEQHISYRVPLIKRSLPDVNIKFFLDNRYHLEIPDVGVQVNKKCLFFQRSKLILLLWASPYCCKRRRHHRTTIWIPSSFSPSSPPLSSRHVTYAWLCSR